MNKARLGRQTLRMLDANLNRSREGLRVCEDVARFVIASPSITRKLKNTRHAISSIANSFPEAARLLEARDSAEDIGRTMKPDIEIRRADFSDIFAANIERVKESLRVLEELYKIFDSKSSEKFAALRFDIYAVEKKVLGRLSAKLSKGIHRT